MIQEAVLQPREVPVAGMYTLVLQCVLSFCFNNEMVYKVMYSQQSHAIFLRNGCGLCKQG